MGRLAARLATVEKPLRSDAVIMRPIVANLSPEWFAEHNPDWRENGLNARARAAYDALLAQAVEEYGVENIVVASLHLDESLPQWQIAVTPVTDDGRLTQKPWYSGPKALQGMGQRFRQAVADTGIAVDFKPSARSKEHLSSDEFQRRADRAKADAYLAADARQDADLYLSAAKRDAAAERADWAEPDDHGQGEGPKRRRARERAHKQGYDAGLTEGRAEAAKDRQRAAGDLRAAQAAKAALDRARAEWEAESPTRAALLNEWLDRPTKTGRTPRQAFDAYTGKVADEWLAQHPDVKALDDADVAALVDGGTAALDEALAEAQRIQGLR